MACSQVLSGTSLHAQLHASSGPEVPLHLHVCSEKMIRTCLETCLCTETDPQRVCSCTRAHTSASISGLDSALAVLAFVGGGARGTVLQITARSRTSSLLEQVSKG